MLSEDTTGAGGQSHPYFLFLSSVQCLDTGHKDAKLIVVVLMSDIVVLRVKEKSFGCEQSTKREEQPRF